MMSAPQEKGNIETGPVPYTVPPGAPQPNPFIFFPGAPQPSTMPINIQWNVQPPPGQTIVYPAPPMWNVSPGQPQMIYPTIQPAAPGYNVPAPNMPQVTQPSQWQQVLLQGKPKSLGIVLIVMAILQIFFAIALPFLAYSYTFVIGVQFWGPVFYIIAGSLSIAAQQKNDVCLVRGSLAFNILSSLCSFIGIVLNIVDFGVMRGYCYDDDYHHRCNDNAGPYTIVSILFLINLLVFCVSISVSVFGCRALQHVPSNVSPVFVIQREFVVSVPPNSSSDSQAPPPYAVQADEKPAL